jgi:hypothetical protein
MSRYDVLAKRQAPLVSDQPDKPAAASRRSNPQYKQFSAYIPIDLYRKLKMRLVEKDLDLGEALEIAITDWLQEEHLTENAASQNP